MNSFQRAFCYVTRKKIRTLLLFLTLSISCMMILGTYLIRSSSQNVLNDLERNAESKIVLETINIPEGFKNKDINQLVENTNVSWINRLYEYKTNFDGLYLIGDEENTGEFTVHAQDRIEYDSAFEEKIYRIIDGDYPENADEVVLNQYLANYNGLSVGDQITEDYVICGIFVSGTEKQQTESVAADNRIENQIFLKLDEDNIDGEHYPNRIACYLEHPDEIEKTLSEFKSIYEDNVSMRVDNHTYMKIRTSIEGTDRVTFLIMMLTVITSVFVIGFLLSMWMRERKMEIAILRSVGITRQDIAFQMFIESVVTYLISLCASNLLINEGMPYIINSNVLLSELVKDSRIKIEDFAMIGLGGLIIIILLVGISIFPYLIKQPKEILSEMEG